MKGRASQINPTSRFEPELIIPGFFNDSVELEEKVRTKYISSVPKTIVNKVNSPDLNFNYSLNPYQGCEHGCVYCYARPTHNYWGFSSGLDFESKIVVKKGAPELLAKKISSKAWKADTIVLSGNTDCYQPAEAKHKITRSLLQVFLRYKHPVSIITKNALILRDIDLLTELNKDRLVSVVFSITTLDPELQRKMEPRTSSPKKKLKAIQRLSDLGIPCYVMMGPIIPSLTDHEIMSIAKESKEHGALNLHYSLLRLNFDLSEIFINWLEREYPDRKEKVLKAILSTRGGKFSATIKENRMKGKGSMAKIIDDQVKFAQKKYFPNPTIAHLNRALHEKHKSDQLSLF